MLELHSTDSTNKCFEFRYWESQTTLLFYNETICSYNSKNVLSKITILSLREADIMMDDNIFLHATQTLFHMLLGTLERSDDF